MNKMMLAMAVAGLFGTGVAMAEDAAKDAAVKEAPAPKAAPAQPAALPMMEPEPAAAKAFDWAQVPEVVAKVGDQKITRDQLKAFVDKQFQGGGIPADAPDASVKMMLYSVAQMMVGSAIMEDALKANGLGTVEEVARKTLQTQVDGMTPEEHKKLEEQLKAQNMTVEQAINQFVESPMAQRVAAQALGDKLGADVKSMSPEDAKKFYDENVKTMFTEPGYIEVAHILLQPKKDGSDDAAVKAKLEGILAEVRANPASFGDKAKAESVCPSSKNGGELGMKITADSQELDKDFMAAALPLKEGEISEVVKTQFGYHIIKCVKKTEDKVEPYTPELEKDIQKMEADKEKTVILQKYMTELEAKLKPEILMEKPKMPMQMQMPQE